MESLAYLHRLHGLWIKRLSRWRSPDEIAQATEACTDVSAEIAPYLEQLNSKRGLVGEP
jgi:hypothetical protein